MNNDSTDCAISDVPRLISISVVTMVSVCKCVCVCRILMIMKCVLSHRLS